MHLPATFSIVIWIWILVELSAHPPQSASSFFFRPYMRPSLAQPQNSHPQNLAISPCCTKKANRWIEFTNFMPLQQIHLKMCSDVMQKGWYRKCMHPEQLWSPCIIQNCRRCTKHHKDGYGCLVHHPWFRRYPEICYMQGCLFINVNFILFSNTSIGALL